MRRVVAALVIAASAVACAADVDDAPPALDDAIDAAGDDAAGDRTTDEDGDDVDRTRGDAQLEHEVRYGQAGGIAGRMEELRIAPDGTGELTSRGREPVEVTLDQDRIAKLAVALDRADLEDQPTDQMSDPAVMDAFTYELVYGEGRVLTDEFAAPDELRPALELLGDLVEELRADG